MKHLRFQHGEFVKSAASFEQCPSLNVFEIALIGRSNVGKSSLINHLLRTEKLVKVSKTPGKTRLLNFFLIDQALALVDLPGYGYAKVSKTTQKDWEPAIEDYLVNRKNLKLLLILLDINRVPNTQDLMFFEWAAHHQKHILVVFTKADKLNQKERNEQLKKNLAALDDQNKVSYVLYSIKDAKARNALIHQINLLMHDLT